MLSPNEGIRRSLKNGLFIGLLGGLGFWLGKGLLGWPAYGRLGWLGTGLGTGLFGGLGAGLFFGLGAAMQHYTLRFWLWQARCTPAPWRYVAFLDDAVEQLLLRKVGGGYIFRHRLLQDYFASLDIVPPHDPLSLTFENITTHAATIIELTSQAVKIIEDLLDHLRFW